MNYREDLQRRMARKDSLILFHQLRSTTLARPVMPIIRRADGDDDGSGDDASDDDGEVARRRLRLQVQQLPRLQRMQALTLSQPPQ